MLSLERIFRPAQCVPSRSLPSGHTSIRCSLRRATRGAQTVQTYDLLMCAAVKDRNEEDEGMSDDVAHRNFIRSTPWGHIYQPAWLPYLCAPGDLTGVRAAAFVHINRAAYVK